MRRTWRAVRGTRRAAHGVWHTACGARSVASGPWHEARGNWYVVHGTCHVVLGPWCVALPGFRFSTTWLLTATLRAASFVLYDQSSDSPSKRRLRLPLVGWNFEACNPPGFLILHPAPRRTLKSKRPEKTRTRTRTRTNTSPYDTKANAAGRSGGVSIPPKANARKVPPGGSKSTSTFNHSNVQLLLIGKVVAL